MRLNRRGNRSLPAHGKDFRRVCLFFSIYYHKFKIASGSDETEELDLVVTRESVAK